uniref:Zinc finger, CCHC-type n=1 Tax=Gongylonema pulchrum TaxID=637853 RepID=A0A183DDQ5_9BILA
LVVAELISLFNRTEIFLSLAPNLTESEVFTEVEMDTLSKLLNKTKDWLAEKMDLQSKLKPTDVPALSVIEAKDMYLSLDREMKYLLNKMKFAKPKTPKKEVKTNETAAENNDTTPETSTVSVEEERSEIESDKVPHEGDEEKDGRTAHDNSEL